MTQRTDKTTSRDGQDQVQDQVQDLGDRETALQEYNAEVLARQPGLREAFLVQLLAVPEPNDDAAANIVGVILQAEEVEDLDKPWDSDGMRAYFHRVVIVETVTRRPSDYKGGLGAYLGCQCLIPETGERVFVSCGSVSSVAQLVRAHTIEALPLVVVPTPAKKPTSNGYWPYHLQMLGSGPQRVALFSDPKTAVQEQERLRRERDAQAAANLNRATADIRGRAGAGDRG